MTQNNLGNALEDFFANANFRAGLEQLGRLIGEEDLTGDPQLLSLIDVLRVMCHEASGEGARASEALDAFIAHVERQPENFCIDWSFTRLRRFTTETNVEAVAAHRRFLLGLLDAVSGKSRDEILAALRRLRQQ